VIGSAASGSSRVPALRNAHTPRSRLAPAIRHRYRSFTAAAIVIIGAVLGGAGRDQQLAIDGTLFDLASYLSARPAGPEPVALVAIDDESLTAERFKGLPRSFYGPWLGEMTDALFSADAQAVGFDIFFSYSAAEAAGANYDWRFKDAIARHLPRLTTVRTLHVPLADEWAAAFYDPEADAAAGRDEGSAIAYAELSRDADGIVRRFKPVLRAESTSPLPTFVGALLERARAPVEQDFFMRPTRALESIPAYRFADVLTCSERDPEALRQAFSHYLAPLIVARLSRRDETLRLGGERREVSVMFADLSGFTALSGAVDPEALMAVTNRYLGLLVEAVESTGGYVDKFIGDAVMAVWGAPAADDEHALHATEAAMNAVRLIDEMCRADEARMAPSFSVKIGINTGEAVVGNVGAPHRYNYTAVGETVNIASRLESLPGEYGCPIVLGPGTAARVIDHYLLCELDRVQVKGKKEPIAIFQPIARRTETTLAKRLYVEQYSAALKAYREARFDEAAALWAATSDPRGLAERHPASVMAQRALGQ
jgi:class 3 adenylate cyclase